MAKHAYERPPRKFKIRRRVWGRKFFGTVGAAVAVFTFMMVSVSYIPTTPSVAEVYPNKTMYQLFTAPESIDVPIIERDRLRVVYTPPADIGTYAALAATFINDTTKLVQFPFKVGVPLTDGFGPRTKVCEQEGCQTTEYHEGQDFAPGEGADVQAIADGIVLEVVNFKDNTIGAEDTSKNAAGTYIKIQHTIDGQTVVSTYAHLQYNSIPLVVGEKVRVGYIVGKVGNTGLSTGAHLHLTINLDGRNIDPMPYLSEKNLSSAQFPDQ